MGTVLRQRVCDVTLRISFDNVWITAREGFRLQASGTAPKISFAQTFSTRTSVEALSVLPRSTELLWDFPEA
jgi:hypothetical protein